MTRVLAIVLLLGGCDAKKPPPPTPPAAAAPAPDAASDWQAWPAAAPEKHRAILLLHGAGGAHIFLDTDHKKYPEAFAAHGYAVYMPDFGAARDGLEKAKRALDRVADQRVAVVGFSRGAWVGI